MAALSFQPASGNWDSNWDLGATPTALDTCTISTTKQCTVPNAYVAVCLSLVLSSTAGTTGLDVQPGGQLTVGDTSTSALAISWTTASATPPIKVGGLLKSLGNWQQGNAPIKLYGNGAILQDRNTTHTGTNTYRIGSTNNQANAYVMTETTGGGAVTKTSRATIGSTATGNSSTLRFINGGFVGNGMARCTGVDFSYIADGSSQVFQYLPNGGTGGTADFFLKECRFDHCGSNLTGSINVGAAVSFELINCTARNSVGSASLFWVACSNSTAMTTGKRDFKGLRLDRPLSFGMPNLSVDDVVIDCTGTGSIFTILAAATFDQFKRIIGRDTGTWNHVTSGVTGAAAGAGIPVPVMTGSNVASRVWLVCADKWNPRWFTLGNNALYSGKNIPLDEFVQDAIGCDDAGDGFCWTDATALASQGGYTMDRLHCLPAMVTAALTAGALDATSGTPRHGGKPSSPLLQANNRRMNYTRLTYWMVSDGIEAGLQAGEGQTSAALIPMYGDVQGCIAFSPDTTWPVRLLVNNYVSTFAGNWTPSTIRKNVVFNARTGVNYPPGYRALVAGANNTTLTESTQPLGATFADQPGAGDLNVDPDFFDIEIVGYKSGTKNYWRCLPTFYRYATGAGADTPRNDLGNFFTEMMKSNDPTGFNSLFTVDTVFDWKNDGWAATNPAVQGLWDGVDPGAAGWRSAGGGPNLAPTAVITSPPGTITVLPGTPITFTGTGTDPEDGTLTGGSLQWTSSLAGAIGIGNTFVKSDLSLGTHVISLTVMDSGALTAIATVTVNVQLQPASPSGGVRIDVGDGQGAVDLLTFGFIYERRTGDLTPAIGRPPSVAIPGGIGERATGADAALGPRVINVTGTLRAQAPGQFAQAMRELAYHCSGGAGGSTARPVLLSFGTQGLAPAVQQTVYFDAGTFDRYDPQELQQYGALTLPFVALDARAYDANPTTLPLSTTAQPCPVGTARVKPLTVIDGPFTTATITLTDANGVTRGSLTITAPASTVLTGHTVEIDHEAETITHVHGGTRDSHPEWIPLSGGGDFFAIDPEHAIADTSALVASPSEAEGDVVRAYDPSTGGVAIDTAFEPVFGDRFATDTSASYALTNQTLAYQGTTGMPAGTGRMRFTNTASAGQAVVTWTPTTMIGAQYPYVILRYKVITGPATVSAFYTTAGHGISGSYRRDANLTADGAWHTLVLDMRQLTVGGTDWATSVITGLALVINGGSAVVDLNGFAVASASPKRVVGRKPPRLALSAGTGSETHARAWR